MAVRFSANTQFYSTTAGNPTGNLHTIICWIYLTTDRNDYSNVCGMYDANVACIIGTDSDGTALIGYDGLVVLSSGLSLTAATWYKVALVMNGASFTIYRAIGTGALGSANNPTMDQATGITGVDIGQITSAEWWNGRVANYKQWNAVLTQAEIEIEMSFYQPIRRLNLIRNHHFREASNVEYAGVTTALTTNGTPTTEDGPPLIWSPHLLAAA